MVILGKICNNVLVNTNNKKIISFKRYKFHVIILNNRAKWANNLILNKVFYVWIAHSPPPYGSTVNKYKCIDRVW